MHYHFGYPRNTSGVGFTPNVCITQGNDGIVEWYGATLTDPAFGTIDPNETALGQTVYAFKWKADGTFRMRFGVLGNEIVPDTDIIHVTTRVTPVILLWDAVNLYYEGTNLAMATELINEYVEGEDRCALVKPIPNEFIRINFNLQRGTA